MATPRVRDRSSRSAPARAGAVSLAVIIAVLASGCASRSTTPDPAATRAAIDAVNKQFMDAFARKDAPSIGLLYTDDARAYPPGAPLVEGRPAIETMWTGVLALPVSECRLETIELTGGGDWAWESGRFTLVGTDSQAVDTGKYVVVWKHDEAGWKLYRDIWNSDAPATAPAAEQAPPAGK